MPAPSGVIYHGQTTVGTTAVQITTTVTVAVFGICIKADDGNTGNVFIGEAGVTTSNGFKLAPGEAITIEIDFPEKLYAIADAADQKVHWLAV